MAIRMYCMALAPLLVGQAASLPPPKTGWQPALRRRQEIFANTSATFTDRADHAGTTLPARAVSPPIVTPHHSASMGTRNAGKKAMGNLTPPVALIAP